MKSGDGNIVMTLDSMNSGGGSASGGSYSLQDTTGEFAVGDSSGGAYNMNAGYQAVAIEDTTIAITVAPSDVTMTAYDGVGSNSGLGNTSLTIVTNSYTGYSLSLAKSNLTIEALRCVNDLVSKCGDSYFDDYAPAGAVPDFSWTMAADKAMFGFAPKGGDISQRYKNNDIDTCGTGSIYDGINYCWDGLGSSASLIAERNSPTSELGSTTSIYFKSANGANHIQPSGTYKADLVVTAVSSS